MKNLALWIGILTLLVLLGCTQVSDLPNTTSTTTPPKPVTVYAGAVEDYLNPVQAYSRPL